MARGSENKTKTNSIQLISNGVNLFQIKTKVISPACHRCTCDFELIRKPPEHLHLSQTIGKFVENELSFSKSCCAHFSHMKTNAEYKMMRSISSRALITMNFNFFRSPNYRPLMVTPRLGEEESSDLNARVRRFPCRCITLR